MKLKNIIRKLIHASGSNYCIACNSRVRFFNKIGDDSRQEISSIRNALDGFETLNMDAYYCPICSANDRDRLILSYLLHRTISADAVLEIAPSNAIRNKLLSEKYNYRCCDLYMPGVDDVCDITNMTCYEDAAFDVVICSHVLEHIHDDDRAVAEIARILKPKGKALILVPIPLGLENNLYDPSLIDPAERIKYYGQNDHVRMYSKNGLVKLISNAGLKVETWGRSNVSVQFDKVGLSATSTLYLAVKQ
jgi:SAM-dependent methyltransferase